MDKINKNSVKKKSRRLATKRKRTKSRNALKSDEQIKICCSFDANLSASAGVGLDRNLLSNWSFPFKIHEYYARKRINKLFDWQVECLNIDNVLEGRNLVYSAPTSAGKSMVSDILLYKKLLEHKKKAIIILPFISVTQEKMLSLKPVLRAVGVRVDAFAGGVNPRGGLARVDVAVCTIEKANNIINKLIEDNKLNEIGLIVVDELHMIGNSSRGFILELLLTKVLYLKSKIQHNIQIVGMSATIPNLDVIAKWLNAALYVTDFRPVPLYERVNIGDVIYDLPEMSQYRQLELKDYDITKKEGSDDTNLIFLAIETLLKGLGALVFCATKAMCERLCRSLAANIYEFGKGKKAENDLTNDFKTKIRSAFNFDRINEVLQQLERCPAGLDPSIAANLRFGVAYHHAGLSMDERCIIEQAFRNGVVKILCATSTLSAGVNLPARLVIIKSPLDFRNSVMDVMTYRQMIGRAGRQGVDTMGESILMCPESHRKQALELINSRLQPISSCLMNLDLIDGQSNNTFDISSTSFSGLKRAILEVIANGMANSYEDISEYISNSFLASISSESLTKSIIDDIIEYLTEEKLIHCLTDSDSDRRKVSPTQFGKAVLASGISPKDGSFILNELNKAKESLCLCNDLHLLYEVTPINLSEQLEYIDWQHFLTIWSKLDTDMRKVGKLVGVSENSIISLIRNSRIFREEERLIHKRFYAALVLHELVDEVPLSQVANKFKCNKGVVQSLQQSASLFAGMLTVFCNRLGWHNLEILIEQFQSRLYFGVQRELIDLMRITSLNSSVARLLYNNKYDTVVSLANVDKSAEIELCLLNAGPFDKNKPIESSVMWVPALGRALTVREMAKAIVFEAKELINKDLGIKVYDLSQTSSTDSNDVLSEDWDDFSQESNDLKPNSENYTKILSPEKKTIEELKENYKQIEDSVEDMSFVEESAISCENNTNLMSPMNISITGCANTSLLDKFETSSSVVKAIASSTPIAQTSRSLILKSEKRIENHISTKDKLKDESNSFSLGDSLDDISWDRLNTDFNKFHDLNECKELDEFSLKNVSTISANLLINRCESPDLFRDSDTLSSKSGHSSKRSSSPSPSGKMCERVNKKPFSTTSSLSLINSDDSLMFSEDSINSYTRDDSNVEPIDCSNSSIITKTQFKELEIGDKFLTSVIDSKNLSLIDNILNNLINKKVFCLNFKTKLKNLNPIQLIGSKIKTLRTTAEDICGLDMNYNNTIVSAMILCFESERTVYYVTSVEALEVLKVQLKHKLQSDSQIITFDINLCYKILRQCFEIDIQVLNSIDWFDVRIAHWILDPESNRPNSVQQMVKIYSKLFSYLFNPRNNLIETECISTALMFPLINQLLNELENKNQLKAYKRIEISSRLTIANMELNGICVDFKYINKLLDMLKETKRQLEAKAYSIAKTKFNFSKPSEIATILFENQKLLTNYYSIQKNSNKGRKVKNDRKLPKHLSTSKASLKKLILLTNNPMPRIVMEWRRVDNAMKKSIIPVLNYLSLDSESGVYRIRGLCDDWSSTGRISMYEPNLIGIERDFTVEGIDLEENGSNQSICFSLRKCFIARKGYVLVSADYSQLELRILAHLSKDKLLTQVLNSGGDVFKNIASIWKSKRIEEITEDERQQSKRICYGMVYGMGEKALSEDLEVSEEEAKQFMESFVNRYEGVKQFIANTVEECREKGFVETMSGRRRYLPHIQSSNSMLRSKAERQAVNSTIQGSAADLLKTAMTALQISLTDHKYMDSRIVLQMYDELMYEVLEQWSQKFVYQLTQSMENCLKDFSVDLPVRAKLGPNWAQLEQIEPSDNI